MASNLNKSMKLTNITNNFVSTGGKIGKIPPVNSFSPDAELPTGSITPSTSNNGGSNAAVTAIPFIRNKDNTKLLPTYAQALQRSADEYLAAEDLDNIQLDLESLLSNVALRSRVLKLEYESIDKDEKRNDKRNKDKQPISPSSVVLANDHFNSNNLNNKRKRDDPTTTMRKKQSSITILKQQSKHTKNNPLAVLTDDSMDYIPTQAGTNSGGNNGNYIHVQRGDHKIQKVTIPKNDMPNKFWLSIEPFCMPMTNEDLRLIDNLLEQYKGPLVPPIPPLGPHYSETWANDDIKDMQQASQGNQASRGKSNTSSSALPISTDAMIKKAEGKLDDCVTGPLTQRLVSALIEEFIIAHPSEQAAVGEHSNSSSSENTHNSAAPFKDFRSLSMLRNCVGIENRIKKELMECGVLDVNELNDDDEVLHEIKRVTSEISSISTYNTIELKQLRTIAANEIKRMEIKRKLDIVDQEILETYKRTLQCRSKRKNYTIEEQQEIYRLTSEQRALADQLERMAWHQ